MTPFCRLVAVEGTESTSPPRNKKLRPAQVRLSMRKPASRPTAGCQSSRKSVFTTGNGRTSRCRPSARGNRPSMKSLANDPKAVELDKVVETHVLKRHGNEAAWGCSVTIGEACWVEPTPPRSNSDQCSSSRMDALPLEPPDCRSPNEDESSVENCNGLGRRARANWKPLQKVLPLRWQRARDLKRARRMVAEDPPRCRSPPAESTAPPIACSSPRSCKCKRQRQTQSHQ
mmetsp:Transcript_172137/g.551759  ORF Transcript_172137/g.551759 Transcript_172137/m.551759 type:complete len:230 (+) Transcript_172137:1967-2656(+)